MGAFSHWYCTSKWTENSNILRSNNSARGIKSDANNWPLPHSSQNIEKMKQNLENNESKVIGKPQYNPPPSSKQLIHGISINSAPLRAYSKELEAIREGRW